MFPGRAGLRLSTSEEYWFATKASAEGLLYNKADYSSGTTAFSSLILEVQVGFMLLLRCRQGCNFLDKSSTINLFQQVDILLFIHPFSDNLN